MLYSHLLSKSQHNWQGLRESCRRVLCSASVRVVFLTSWHLLNSWKGKSAERTEGVREKRLQTRYMDTTLKRPVERPRCFAGKCLCCDVWAAMETQTSNVQTRHRLEIFGIPIPTLVFCIRAGKTQQGFGCMPHHGNNEMFFHCKFLRDGVMYTNYTSTSKCLGLFFFLSMCLFQVWGAHFLPQISVCSHLSLRD